MYDLKLNELIEKIKKDNSKNVLLQLPDGLKNKAGEIIDELKKKTNSNFFIWFGSCFGACDLPLGMDVMNIDLIVQFGHNKFNKEEW